MTPALPETYYSRIKLRTVFHLTLLYILMVHFTLFTDSNTMLFTYMFIYNITLITLFWVLFTVVNTKFKTLQAFNGFSFDSFHLLLTTILLFSMAGVPPFLGFFSKLFILTLLTNQSFFLLYSLFFVLLLIGLYFYVQNIRFLHSSNPAHMEYAALSGQERVSVHFYYFSIWVLTLIIAGTTYVDDVLLVFTWLMY